MWGRNNFYNLKKKILNFSISILYNATVFLLPSRYHIDEEQRFAHLVPGKVSDELRSAMGLKTNQLPRFIYRMRLYGYPPGWLDEAKITHSGITLINESSGMLPLWPGSSESLNQTNFIDTQVEIQERLWQMTGPRIHTTSAKLWSILASIFLVRKPLM